MVGESEDEAAPPPSMRILLQILHSCKLNVYSIAVIKLITEISKKYNFSSDKFSGWSRARAYNPKRYGHQLLLFAAKIEACLSGLEL